MITDEELSKGLLILKVIWFGMLGSLVIYLIIGLLIATNLKTARDESTYAVLKPALYIFTIVVLIVTKYLKEHILSGKGQHRQATQSFQHPALQTYTSAMILAWALSEGIGIFGLVLFLLGKNRMDLYLLILISAAALLIYHPRKDDLIGLAKKS
jgi:DMSO reductase anchor subunit